MAALRLRPAVLSAGPGGAAAAAAFWVDPPAASIPPGPLYAIDYFALSAPGSGGGRRIAGIGSLGALISGLPPFFPRRVRSRPALSNFKRP